MIVDINEIERCLRYFKSINDENFDDIVWMRGDERLLPGDELLKEYQYLGLSNRDFPSIAGWLPGDIGIRVSVLTLTDRGDKE